MKDTKYKIYILMEILLFALLLVFQIIYIANGNLLIDKSKNLIVPILILHVIITLGSFVYTLVLYLTNKIKMKENLFVVYFLFAFLSDIFFSFVKFNFLGHLGFVLAYLTFMFIRKAKLYEYIGIGLFGVTANIVLLLLKKNSFIVAIDCFLAPILILNMIMMIINYIKKKNKGNLLLMYALILIFISDLSIALSVAFKTPILINIMCLITWPTYVIGCILINSYYKCKKILDFD